VYSHGIHLSKSQRADLVIVIKGKIEAEVEGDHDIYHDITAKYLYKAVVIGISPYVFFNRN